MRKLLAAAALGGALALGAMTGSAEAQSKKYWDDGWASGGKSEWNGGSYATKVNFLKGVAPSDWSPQGPYGNRDGVNTSERKGKSFVGRFTAYSLYNDDNLPSGKKPKLLGFDVVGGISKIVPYYNDGKLYYAAVLQKGYKKGYAVVRWQLGKKTLYTSALRIVASPNGKDHGKKIYEPKKPEEPVKKDDLVNGNDGENCLKDPLGKIGAARKNSCAV